MVYDGKMPFRILMLSGLIVVTLVVGACQPGLGGGGNFAVCGDGIVNNQEQCDDGSTMNGTTTCGCTTQCSFPASTTVCRESAGVCDVAETCDGTGACPADGFASLGVQCVDADDCNGDEACDGKGACAAGQALVCDDGSAATADTCLAVGGCVRLSLGAGADTPLRGNTSGGTLFRDTCPPGEVMIGLDGTVGASFDQMQVVCGVPSLSADLVVTLGAGTTLPMRGTTQNTPISSRCPSNQMVVGFVGRAGALIDQITLSCAPLIVDQNATLAAPGAITALAPAGGTGGNLFDDTPCPSGQVSVGANIRGGGSIDAFGIICGTPTMN